MNEWNQFTDEKNNEKINKKQQQKLGENQEIVCRKMCVNETSLNS